MTRSLHPTWRVVSECRFSPVERGRVLGANGTVKVGRANWSRPVSKVPEGDELERVWKATGMRLWCSWLSVPCVTRLGGRWRSAEDRPPVPPLPV